MCVLLQELRVNLGFEGIPMFVDRKDVGKHIQVRFKKALMVALDKEDILTYLVGVNVDMIFERPMLVGLNLSH